VILADLGYDDDFFIDGKFEVSLVSFFNYFVIFFLNAYHSLSSRSYLGFVACEYSLRTQRFPFPNRTIIDSANEKLCKYLIFWCPIQRSWYLYKKTQEKNCFVRNFFLKKTNKKTLPNHPVYLILRADRLASSIRPGFDPKKKNEKNNKTE